MSNFQINRGDLKAILGWGDHKIAVLLTKPKKFMHVAKLSASGKGRRIEHYQITDIVPALRSKAVDDTLIAKLIALDSERRREGGE